MNRRGFIVRLIGLGAAALIPFRSLIAHKLPLRRRINEVVEKTQLGVVTDLRYYGPYGIYTSTDWDKYLDDKYTPGEGRTMKTLLDIKESYLEETT